MFKYYEELQSLRTVTLYFWSNTLFKYYEELQSLRTTTDWGLTEMAFKYYEELQSLRTHPIKHILSFSSNITKNYNP